MNIQKYLKETIKYLLRSYPFIHSYIREIDELYGMSFEKLEKRNEEKFLQLFRMAYDKSPFYHKLYSEAGINRDQIKCLADIKRLPVITKKMVKQHADEMLTGPRWKVLSAHSSGTTGTPLKIYQDWPSIWRTQAYIYYTRARLGFRYGQPLVSLRGNLDKSSKCLKIHVSNTLYISSYNINQQTVKFYYDRIVKHKPVAIEGYPSSLYALSLMLRDAGLQLHIPVTFTSSETLLDYQRELIEKVLNTQIYDHYGMVEHTICLVETSDHCGYYEAPGYSINEYLEDGEICTSLINESFPLIRYKSNDVIELSEEIFDVPRVVARKIMGRVDDFVIGKDGSRVTRISLKNGQHIKACQLIQKERGKLIIKIVPDGGFTEKDKKIVISETEKRVGKGNMDIETQIVDIDQLIYSRRGKFKLVVNLLDSKEQKTLE